MYEWERWGWEVSAVNGQDGEDVSEGGVDENGTHISVWLRSALWELKPESKRCMFELAENTFSYRSSPREFCIRSRGASGKVQGGTKDRVC